MHGICLYIKCQHTFQGKVPVNTTSSSLLEEDESELMQSGSIDGAGWVGGGLRGSAWASVRGGGVGLDS